MDDLASLLLNRLIEKTFAEMAQSEKLAFIEKLFVAMEPADQTQFLLSLSRQVKDRPAGMLALKIVDDELQDIAPWRMCCRMMAKVDGAATLGALDPAEPAQLFQALADETRIRIIKLLSEGERRVDDLTQALALAQSTVSHHLRILKEAGLIQGERRGRSTYYVLTGPVKVAEYGNPVGV